MPRRDQLNTRARRFIERMGVLSQEEGLTRIAGRMVGLLLLTPGECSLDEMADDLGVSKASISKDARHLVQLGFIERSSRPGDRRDYYRVAPDIFVHSLEVSRARMQRFHALIHEAGAIPVAKPEVRDRLDELERSYQYVLRALAEVIDGWHAMTARGTRKRGTGRR